MSHRVHFHQNLILAIGTQVVALKPIMGQHGRTLHPAGAVGVILRAPKDLEHDYRVRFADAVEASIHPRDLTPLALYKEGQIGNATITANQHNLFDHVIFRCVIGSQAYGLAAEGSDVDRRGFYLPPAELHWSLYGVPEQIENEETQEAYWEVQKFVILALKANPNVLECLYSPLIETRNELVDELLAIREGFLSKIVFQTYNGYILSQFKKMQADLRNQGKVKWKHVMHLLRLLLSGIRVLRERSVPVRVEEHRDQLLAIKRGEIPWEETERWRKHLHQEFDQALTATSLPDRPDYQKANEWLIKVRRSVT
jgi:predicted nucleotidyltransferase